MSYQSVGQEAVARLHAQREIERLQKDYQDLVVDAEILQQKVLQLEAERDDLRQLCSTAGLVRAQEKHNELRALLFEGADMWDRADTNYWKCDLDKWLAWLEKVEALR